MVALGLVLAGCQQDAPVELAEGQEPFLRYCAGCHANDGSGKPPGFPPLAGSEWLDKGPEAVALVVLHGLSGEIEVAGQTYRGYMPPMQHVSDDEISAMLGYMGRTWADWPEVPQDGELSRLRELDVPRPLQGRRGLEHALREAGL